MSSNNSHEKHRERLKARFMKEGLNSFEDHNILELLLFYAIPQKDVNDIAHALMDEFGSFSAVLDADFESLIKVKGVGKHTATLIKLIPQLSRAYLMDKDTRYPDFSDFHKLGTYLVNYYIGETNEKMIAILLNNRAEMIDIVLVSEGTVNRTDGNIRKIAQNAMVKNAASIVLAHNHPDGNCTPSAADMTLTGGFKDILDRLGIPLVEHIVVGGSSYMGILTHQRSGSGKELYYKPKK